MSSGERQRLATWVLTRCMSDYKCDSFMGDLMEQYEERGGWWYWRQALGAVRAHIARLLVTATQTDVPAAEFVADLVMWVTLGIFAVAQLPIYAGLFISSTSLIPSELSLTVVSILIGAALIGAVATAHKIRMRTAKAT